MCLAEAVQVDEQVLERVDAAALAAAHPELEDVDLVDEVVHLGEPHRRQVDQEAAPQDAVQELPPAHGLRQDCLGTLLGGEEEKGYSRFLTCFFLDIQGD